MIILSPSSPPPFASPEASPAFEAESGVQEVVKNLRLVGADSREGELLRRESVLSPLLRPLTLDEFLRLDLSMLSGEVRPESGSGRGRESSREVVGVRGGAWFILTDFLTRGVERERISESGQLLSYPSSSQLPSLPTSPVPTPPPRGEWRLQNERQPSYLTRGELSPHREHRPVRRGAARTNGALKRFRALQQVFAKWLLRE